MITLRPHQTRFIHATHQARRDGFLEILSVAPTGMGKRIIAVWWCNKAQEQGKRVLFVTNRRLLVEQMFEEVDGQGISYGVIMSGTHPVDSSATVQIASLQTLRSRYFDTPELLPPADLILIDEAHQEPETYKKLMELYHGVMVIALTATPVGPQGRSLTPPYGVVVEEVKNTELIRDGWLLPTTVYAPSEPNIEGVKVPTNRSTTGEFSQEKLGKAVQECTVFADVFNEWAPFADRKTICFCPGIPYARDLERQFTARLGPERAFLVCNDTSDKEKARIFKEMRTGSGRVIISVDMLREGLDLPELSCAIDLQPNTHLRTYWQKVGRIKRPFPGQTEAIYLDFAGNYWRFNHPNEDPDWSVAGDETTQDRIKKNRESGEEKQPIACSKCGHVRTAGAKCPACGFESAKPIRRIRMGDGQLKEIPAIEKKKREKSAEEIQLNKWKSQIFGSHKSGRSLAAAALMYHKQTGEWPKTGWPGVYDRGSMLAKREVRSVFPEFKDIAIAFNRTARQLESAS